MEQIQIARTQGAGIQIRRKTCTSLVLFCGSSKLSQSGHGEAREGPLTKRPAASKLSGWGKLSPRCQET